MRRASIYLTDIVEIARQAELKVVATEVPAESVLGVNTLAELAAVESIWQRRRRQAALLSGVTMIAPETVFFAHDTRIEPDVLLEPNIFFGPGVAVHRGAVIHAYCHIEGSVVGEGSHVGPFARLRPGTDLTAGAQGRQLLRGQERDDRGGRQDQSPEPTSATARRRGRQHRRRHHHLQLRRLLQVPHRHRREAFVGSNSALVAPLTIGDGADVGSGSVVTQDVPADALAFGRARQRRCPTAAASCGSGRPPRRPQRRPRMVAGSSANGSEAGFR